MVSKDDVIRMAREIWGETAILPFYDIERFAALVAAAERDACAKVCEKTIERPAGYNGQWEGYGSVKTQMTGYECAAAIRARSKA